MDRVRKRISDPTGEYPKGIFITGTDTGVGKTVSAIVLGVLLRERGIDVGALKPVQCSGDDARLLKKSLNLPEPIGHINPFFARRPLSPHIAFPREKIRIDIHKIIQAYESMRKNHDLVLVEGAGGLLVPITENYSMIDLVSDLGCDLIIVSRLGLGTINHTLLTIEHARRRGIFIRGIVFNQAGPRRRGIPERTNPGIIAKLGKVPILGVIPRLNKIHPAEILKRCRSSINLKPVLTKTAGRQNKKWTEWDKKYLWHPFTQMRDWLKEDPLIIDEAKGCYLKDTNGNFYLDGVSSLWVNIHGHRHPAIDSALCAQANRLGHSTLLGLSHPPAIALAKELIAIAPQGLKKVFYSDSGSTAVEIALKISYQYWQNSGRTQKTEIVHLANAYHGDTLGSVSVGGMDLFHKVYRGLTFPTRKVNFPDCYRAPEGKRYPAYAFECLEGLEKLFKKSHGSIASLIVEPIVQAAAGMIVWPGGVLKRMERLCRAYDILFITDEVATGFGRTGKMFACDHENIRPDLLCLAKGITGGYLPLAATLTTQKVFDGFLRDYKEQKTFFHGHTYTGNPLACAAALANLKIFREERTLEKLGAKIKFLRNRLHRFATLSHVGDIRQKGFMVGIELVEDKGKKLAYPWEDKMGVRVCQETRKRGVILRPLGNVIVLLPPLSMSVEQLGTLLQVTYDAIKEITERRGPQA